jgi:hypothetical protein
MMGFVQELWMLFRRMWDAMPTSRRARELEAAARRECALQEEFARRVRGLEAQILLLRAENRALLNSVLGIAGIPPIMVTDPAELPLVGQEPKQIPRTASRAPENREKSDEPRDFARDDSFRNNGGARNGTASLQTDSVDNASCKVGSQNGAALQPDCAGEVPGEGVAPHWAASPSAIAGHGSAVPLRGQKRARGADHGRTVAPMRRRSWHQIYRMLELESVRRKDSEA